MTLPTTLSGKKFLLKLETSTPGTYATVCGVKSKTFKASRPKVDTTVQDCDDPDVVSTQSDVGPVAYEFSGSGVATKSAMDTLYAWFEGGTEKNIQIVQTGTGWQTWAGAAVLTDIEQTGDIEGGKVELSISIAGTGAWVRTTNS